MVIKLSLDLNLKVVDDFPKFYKRFRKEVIEDSLDKPISKSVEELKKELKLLVNTQVNTPSKVDSKFNQGKSPTPRETNVLLSKSQEDILQYLTGADLKKHNPQSNHNVVDGSNILTSQFSRNTSSGANRIDVQLSINPYESIQEHYSRALNIFQSSVFAIPNSRGDFDFFLNAGENLDNVTKIDCSTLTGTTDLEPNKGMSPERRFSLDKKNKGYSTWTLKQDFVNRIRSNQTKFINLNPAIQSIQDGKPEEALEYLRRSKSSNQINNLVDKIENITEGRDLPQDLNAYLSIIGLIDTMRIEKRITKQTITYTLVSVSKGPEETDSTKFMDQVRTSLVLWSASNADKWFKEMVNVTIKLIKDFEGGR